MLAKLCGFDSNFQKLEAHNDGGLLYPTRLPEGGTVSAPAAARTSLRLPTYMGIARSQYMTYLGTAALAPGPAAMGGNCITHAWPRTVVMQSSCSNFMLNGAATGESLSCHAHDVSATSSLVTTIIGVPAWPGAKQVDIGANDDSIYIHI